MLGPDGCIYGIPSRASRVLRFDPKTDSATLVGDDLGSGADKWFCRSVVFVEIGLILAEASGVEEPKRSLRCKLATSNTRGRFPQRIGASSNVAQIVLPTRDENYYAMPYSPHVGEAY